MNKLHCMLAVVLVAGNCLAASIENKWVKIEVNEKTGKCRFIDKARGETVVDEIAPVFDEMCVADEGRRNSCVTDNGSNEFGKGEKLTLVSDKPGETVLRVGFTLYEKHPFVDISWSVKNLGKEPIYIKNPDVLNNALAFGNVKDKPNLKVLDGNGGGTTTMVVDKPKVECHNNLLVTFGEEGKSRRSLVIGGLTYHDYQKWAAVSGSEGMRLKLFAPDAIGKRIDPGKTYESKDRFYVDFITDNPFEALERYGLAVRSAQKIKLNMYTFPSVCMWYVNFSHYGGGQTGTNDAPGAVSEMEHVVRSGFLKYSTVAIRLVPDCYRYNSQNGWWDDKHWAMYGSAFHTPVKGPFYRPPYDTTAKWCGKIREMGGIPLTYFATNWRSEDYAEAHPDHMLYNKRFAWKKTLGEYKKEFSKYVLLNKKCYANKPRSKELQDAPPEVHPETYRACLGRNRDLWGHDITDPGFSKHMREVYKNLKDGGLGGMMYDYPWSAWVLGGLEDKYCTMGAAYRRVFQLAYEELGPECWIHERACKKGSDMAVGLPASQRTMGDNDKLSPKSVRMGGLRWYKNRVLINYDGDSKGLQFEERDVIRRIVTMSYVTQGRLLLATSFGSMTKETLYDLSRTYPYHTEPKSARPVDAFVNDYPLVFDFVVSDKWHQLTLYNDSDKESKKFDVSLSGDMCFGSLELDAKKDYYVYDFWNDGLVGKVSGKKKLVQELRPQEARMLAIHEVEDNPQFVSTDRHLMQGYIELKDVKWDGGKKTLSGEASVVEGEPLKIAIALNGSKAVSCSVDKGEARIEKVDKNLIKLCLTSAVKSDVQWQLVCK